MKLRKIAALASLPLLTLGFSSASSANDYSVQSASNLNDATAACYIDTPAWDVPSENRCFTSNFAVSGSSVAIFSVLGVNQTSGQFTVQYLDGTCDSIINTVQEGKVCQRSINSGQKLKQRVRVTDNYSGQSVVLHASASYLIL